VLRPCFSIALTSITGPYYHCMQVQREAAVASTVGDRQGRHMRANPLRPIRTDGQIKEDSLREPGANKPISPFQVQAKLKSRFNVADLQGVEFIGSYAEDESAWPSSPIPEIAFLGRSNVGKSSMLNCLFGERAAKVSKTPGRTQLINIFSAKAAGGKEVARFADLPGYGYAKVAKEDQRAISGFLMQYLKHRTQLKLLILLVDSRRDALDIDADILDFAADTNAKFKVCVVATKVDKLSAMQAAVNLAAIREGFSLPDELPLPFSSVTGKGKKELWSYIKEACEQ
jgi:GTP-binding protein